MKKKIITIVLVAVFVLVLVAINILLKSQNDAKAELKVKQETVNNDTKEESKDKQEIANKGEKVIAVTNQNFEEEVIKSEKKVLVDFYATWCGPCKMLSPIIEELANENEDVKFVRIDIDKCDDIAMQYKIMSIPTLVLIENGEEQNRIIGLVDKTELLNFIEGKK